MKNVQIGFKDGQAIEVQCESVEVEWEGNTIRYMTLTEEEMVAIRWHMGAFDDAARGGSRTLSEVFGRYPLALMLHLSDMEAAYLDEAEEQTCKTE